MAIEYIQGSELPNPEVPWFEDDGVTQRDFSTGWTFKVLVGQAGSAAVFEKTDGVTGFNAASPYQILIEWDAGELDDLTPGGTYRVDIEATFTATGQSLTRFIEIAILPAVLPAVP